MAYTYSKVISTDFPNQRVDADSLQDEIVALSLVSATVQYVNTDEDNDSCDIVFDVEPSSGDKASVDSVVSDHAGIPDAGELRSGGGVLINALGQQDAPTVAAQGTVGSTSWGYKITAFSDTGETLASVEAQVTDGNATLTSSNYNLISWESNSQAIKYGVYRSSAAGTPATTGLIGITTNDFFEDKGEVASGSEPASDTSGLLQADSAVRFSTLSTGVVQTDAQGNLTSEALLHSSIGDVGENDHHNRQHGIGSTSDHTSTTLAGLNALISDATLDDSGDSRPPTAHAIDGPEHTGTLDHTALSSIGTNTHTEIDTHIADDTKHRIINDLGTGATELWSASKIDSELSTIATGYNRRSAVIDYVDCTAAPPTEVLADRYIIDFTGGSIDTGWDGAAKGDIVEFNGTTWDATTPSEGWIAYVDSQNKDLLFVDDGTPTWEYRDVAVTDHGDLAGLGDDDHSQYHNNTRGDLRYYQQTEFISTSAGAADSGKPVVLDAEGDIDASMINDADIDHQSVTGAGTNTHTDIDNHIANSEIHEEPFEAMKEPTGFPNRTDSTLTFTAGTRTFEIDPAVTNYDIWIKGAKTTISTNKSVVWSDVEGIHFFYLDATATLQHTTSFSKTLFAENAYIAAIYWDATNDEIVYAADERHGITMDADTHYQQHLTTGTVYVSGLNLDDFVSDGAGDNNSHAQFSCDNGSILDEDLTFNIADGSPQDLSPILNAPVLFKTGAGADWRIDTPTAYPVKSFSGGSGRLAYNENSGGTWTQTELTNGYFVLAHIFATNDVTYPVIAIQGEQEYSTLATATTGATNEINSLVAAGIPLSEFLYIGAVVYESNSGYTNAIKARVRVNSNGDDFVDFRGKGISPASGSGSGVSTHDDLAGVTPDQHHARDHASTHHSGGVDELTHDSISGSGTNSHTQIDTHIADDTKHRVINDLGTGATDLWSANKIDTELQNISTGYSRRSAVIDYVDCTGAPPTEILGDRYVIDFTVGTVEAGWDGAAKGDIVEFNGTTWDATTPAEGWITYVDSQNKDLLYVDDGTPDWEYRDVAVTDHGDLTGLGDDDHSQYHNDTRGDARYYQKTEFINTSAGAGDSGKPVVLDAAGNIDATMINDVDIDHQSVTGAGTNDHAAIDSHISSTGNPHSVTKSQVGLSNVTNDAQLKRADNDWSAFTTESDPDDDDIILIEKGTGGAKRIVTINTLIQDAGEEYEVEDDGLSATTSTTYQDKVVLTETLDGGDYRIDFYAEIGVNSLNKHCDVRIEVDGTAIAEQFYYRKKEFPGGIGGFAVRNLASGSHTIKIVWRRVELGSAALIRRARISIRRVRTL